MVLRSHVAGSDPDGLFLSPEWVARLFSTVVTPSGFSFISVSFILFFFL